MAERARLESVCTGNRTAGSNPALSATSVRARPPRLHARRQLHARRATGGEGRWGGFDRAVASEPGFTPGERGGTGGRGAGRWGGVAPGPPKRGVRRDAGCTAMARSRGGWVEAVRCGGKWQHGAPAIPPEVGRERMSASSFNTPLECRLAGLQQRTAAPISGRSKALCAILDVARSQPWEARSPGPARRRPRTSSGPEGSSDKGITPGAAVPPGSLVRHGGGSRGKRTGVRTEQRPLLHREGSLLIVSVGGR